MTLDFIKSDILINCEEERCTNIAFSSLSVIKSVIKLLEAAKRILVNRKNWFSQIPRPSRIFFPGKFIACFL